MSRVVDPRGAALGLLLLGLSASCGNASSMSSAMGAAANAGSIQNGAAAGFDALGGAPAASGAGSSGVAAETGTAGSLPVGGSPNGGDTSLGGRPNGGSAGTGADSGAAAGSAGSAGMRGLIHPGGLHTEAELERIRSQVTASAEPWSSAWQALKNSDANANYQPTVSATITDPYAIQNQGHAAYVLAIKWVASGDPSYAAASIRVLDAWTDTVKNIQGTTLRTGIGATQLASAAEILAHAFNGAAGWPTARVVKAQAWFKAVVWPDICRANAQRSSNWGTSAMAGCMATAIFVDGAAEYAYAVDAFQHGFTDAPDGCSGVAQYICEVSGQATEAGRDQGHPQGGVGHLVEVAMMAWNQGLNLVHSSNDRLLAGMEYLAKYNLGGAVPYNANFADPCNVHPSWAVISETGRGSFSPVYELANKLFTLAAVPHPFTTQVLGSPSYVPEETNADHVGLGTLTAH